LDGENGDREGRYLSAAHQDGEDMSLPALTSLFRSLTAQRQLGNSRFSEYHHGLTLRNLLILFLMALKTVIAR